MQRIKTIIIILSASFALTSCSKTYQCHCDMIPGTSPAHLHTVDYKVKASNSTKAKQECDVHDSEYFDCSITQ